MTFLVSKSPVTMPESVQAASSEDSEQPLTIPLSERIKEVVVNYLPLGYITFGGPQAHIALLLDLFVVKRGWLSEEMFTELFAISNAMPGPASTQLAFTVALIRGGVVPGILAFLIWSIPGGIVMGAVGYGVGQLGATSSLPTSVLYIERSLAAASIALVSIAAKQLVGKLMTDKTSCTLAALAVVLVINFGHVQWLIPLIMVIGGIATYLEGEVPGASGNDTTSGFDTGAVAASSRGYRNSTSNKTTTLSAPKKDLHIYFTYSMTTGAILIALFFILLILSGILRSQEINQPINILSTFYFVGAIIFGGGPVVVPLLYSYVVSGTNWLTSTEFLMGFAVINVMPGPNFNFAAYCGALAFRQTGWTSFVGALLAWIGIFLPGLLVKAGVLPIWRHYRDLPVLKRVFKGLNSVAVGLLVAAVYLLWMKAIALPENKVANLGDYTGWTGVMVVAFLAMDTWKVQPWWVVGASAIVGALAWVIDGKP
ncbi:chromate transporter-domain-containing protein [Obelidium mucronatum]|nr:chromate transporter-domain-containing protein [Obelidium mucronatum]